MRRSVLVKTCENCGRDWSRWAEACVHCGSTLHVNTCTSCGGGTYEDACPACRSSDPLSPTGLEVVVVPRPSPRVSGDAVAVSPPVRPPVQLTESYSDGKYGVTADVRVPAGDVEVMNDLSKLATLLELVAEKTNQFQGHSDHTRKIIKDMRTLALEVREEIEVRVGPGGMRR